MSLTFKTIMLRLLSGIGYVWAILITLSVPLLFLGLDAWSTQFSGLSFMKIHPRYQGGEISHRYLLDGNEWIIHQPVFDGLFKNRNNGFVQIVCKSGYEFQKMDSFSQTIDFDQDQQNDFIVHFTNTSETGIQLTIDPLHPAVGDLETWAQTDTNELIFRISINNTQLN